MYEDEKKDLQNLQLEDPEPPTMKWIVVLGIVCLIIYGLYELT